MATMHNDSDIQERIAIARREAEALKERIKQRKEALADSTCKAFIKNKKNCCSED
jgi:guanine nucleotide-binding protein G(I)/G(S)/G(T) subunit beta-1